MFGLRKKQRRPGSWDGMGPVRLRAAVQAATRDGRTILLDLGNDKYFTLDEIGTRFWELAASGQDVAGMVEVLAAEYAAPPEQLQADVRTFVGDLAKRGLVEAA